jgi:hypothetical protein
VLRALFRDAARLCIVIRDGQRAVRNRFEEQATRPERYEQYRQLFALHVCGSADHGGAAAEPLKRPLSFLLFGCEYSTHGRDQRVRRERLLKKDKFGMSCQQHGSLHKARHVKNTDTGPLPYGQNIRFHPPCKGGTMLMVTRGTASVFAGTGASERVRSGMTGIADPLPHHCQTGTRASAVRLTGTYHSTDRTSRRTPSRVKMRSMGL